MPLCAQLRFEDTPKFVGGARAHGAEAAGGLFAKQNAGASGGSLASARGSF